MECLSELNSFSDFVNVYYWAPADGKNGDIPATEHIENQWRRGEGQTATTSSSTHMEASTASVYGSTNVDNKIKKAMDTVQEFLSNVCKNPSKKKLIYIFTSHGSIIIVVTYSKCILRLCILFVILIIYNSNVFIKTLPPPFTTESVFITSPLKY